MSSPVAKLRAVTKAYRGAVALDGVSLTVAPGESVALLGPNGAGKTTALAILLGLRRPDRGEALLFGRSPIDPAARRRIGVTPQATSFPATVRVAELVRLVAAHFHAPVATAELLDRFGIGALARRQAGGLSGGEARRVALALAFAGRPDLVILDEPTGALDVEARQRVWDAILDYRAAGGSILLTSHHLDEVAALADRVVVLAGGRVVAEGPVDEIRAQAGVDRITLRTPVPPSRIAGVTRIEEHRGATVLYATDPGLAIESLVEGAWPLHGIEVRPASLEEAFLQLTRAAP